MGSSKSMKQLPTVSQFPVPDGKAGMTSLVLSCDVKAFDLDGFAAHVLDKLPGYAVPVLFALNLNLRSRAPSSTARVTSRKKVSISR